MSGWIRNDGGMSAEGFKERNDCAVRALALVANMPYKDAHSKFKRLGRKNGHGTRNSDIDTALAELNFKQDKSPMTVGRLLQKYPSGRVYVVKRQHAFAVIDGIIHDTFVTGPKSRVVRCYVAPTTVASTPVVNDRLHSYQKRDGALAAFNRLNDGIRSRYAIAKLVAVEMSITVANANYYVRQF
jgi:hypothetical protein